MRWVETLPGPTTGRDSVAMGRVKDISTAFDILGEDAPLESAFLIKGSGVILASWTRTPVPAEAITAMAATMMASIATTVEVFGLPTPQTALVETERHQILARKLAADTVLILVTGRDVHKRNLYLNARRLATRYASLTRPARFRGPAPHG